MTAMFILTQYFRDQQLEDLVVVSPDAGRVKLAKKFAEKVGAELAILNKERPAQQVAEIAYVIGDVKNKTAVIVDDIIDTAGTLRAAAETVRDEGAKRVFAAATHPVLSGNAFENLAASPFERIVTTDTIPLRPGAPDNITVLSVAYLLTYSIGRIFTDYCVAEVFGGYNQLFLLSARTRARPSERASKSCESKSSASNGTRATTSDCWPLLTANTSIVEPSECSFSSHFARRDLSWEPATQRMTPTTSAISSSASTALIARPT
jgi:hypothetical protein